MASVPSDYVIGPGDELRIRVWGQMDFQVNAGVDRSGEIFLPQVGPVHVAGTAVSALSEHLRTAIGRVYHNFDLTVDLGQIRAIQVYVSGQARRPGVYTISSLSTLVDALFASGGPSVQGTMRRIALRRGSAVVTEFDLYSLLVRGDKSGDVKMQSGDVIFIPAAGPQVAITGSVRVPAIYELGTNESLASVVAFAGGITSTATQARVSVERVEDHRDRHAMEVSYDAAGLATPMHDGDLVHVFSIVPAYSRTVVLRGNTANSGRFAWHPGMRISDLIPDKEALITRDYWWKRTQLGLPAPDFEPTPGFDDLRQPAQDGVIKLKSPAAVEMRTSVEPALLQNGITPQQESTGAQELLGPDGFPRQAMNPKQQAGNASLASAESSLAPRLTPSSQQLERRARAPEIDWDYAVIERLDSDTVKTKLIPFDLGAVVLRHDVSQDLELQSGDVVTVYSAADIRVPIAHQTKLVMLDGEFAHAGFYTAEAGETLRHLVERAGGLTPDAYLYGSEFTRESTRAVQQARIDEYVQTLSLRIQRSNLAIASSAVNSTQELASGGSAQNSERELLASLRQIRATGRIVLEIKPDDSGTVSLPDMALEDGDRFIVPQAPSSVNVVGAVFNQNSFLYSQERRATTYLQMAGGPSRDADRSREFIIRADGEIVSRQSEGASWSNSAFNNLVVNPGDTIVVPEKAYKPSSWRGVLDWSQLFSQFALGAAALSVVR